MKDTHEGKVKSSRPSLHAIRDKRPLDRDPDRSWCHYHTTSTIKLFLVAVHGHQWQHTDKVKSSSLAYNQHETQDKHPLGRDPDRSWCHYHTTIMINALWASTATNRQGENCPDVKLRTSGHWVGTQTGAGVFFTLESIYLYFPPSSQLLYLCFCPVGFLLL